MTADKLKRNRLPKQALGMKNDTRIKTMTMPKIVELVIPEDSIYDKGVQLVSGTIFHVTPIDRFQRIIMDGQIKTNKDGALGYHWSENSYGRNRGYVCLFDFADKADGAIEKGLELFPFLSPRALGSHIAFFIFSPTLRQHLLFVDHARRDCEPGEKYIPDVECWFPSNLSLDFCSEVFTIQIHPLRPLGPHVRTLNALFEANPLQKTRGNIVE